MSKETKEIKEKEGPDEYLAFASDDEVSTDVSDPSPEPDALKDRTLSDLWAKYPVGIDPQFEIRIERRTPKFYMGVKTDGHLETIYQPIDETYVLDKWGGGSYWVRVAGPRKDGAPGKVVYGGRFVNIHGIPKVDSLLRGGPSMVKEDGPIMRPPVLGGGADGDTVVEMAKLMAKDKERADKERQDVNARFLDSQAAILDKALDQQKPNNGANESLKLIKETFESSRDELVSAHKSSIERLEQQVTELRKNLDEEREQRRNSSQNQNQSQPVADLANAFASMATALSKNNTPQSPDPEMQRDMQKTLIDTHAKELQSIREAHKAELEAVRAQMTSQINATRDAYERQIETSRNHHASETQSLRELQLKERESLLKEHERERESLVKEQEREVRSLKEAHAMFVDNLKLTSDSKIEIVRTSNEMLIKKAESDATRLQVELEASKRRVDELQARVEPQDIRSKLGELREMKDLTEDFFGGNQQDGGPQSKTDKIIDKLVDRVFDSPLAEAVAQRIAPGEAAQQTRRVAVRAPQQQIAPVQHAPQAMYRPQQEPSFRAVPRRRPSPVATVTPITAELPKEERLHQTPTGQPSQEDNIALENLLVAAQDAVNMGEPPEDFAQRIMTQVDPEQLKLMLAVGPKAVLDGIVIAAKQTGKDGLLTVGGQRFLKAVLEILNNNA